MIRLRKIRCYTENAVANGIFNSVVYFLVHEGFNNLSMFTCINCSELFAIDLDNPDLKHRSLNDIVKDEECPKCRSKLTDTIKKYPETFRTIDGNIGHFVPPNHIPPDNQSEIVDVWELVIQ